MNMEAFMFLAHTGARKQCLKIPTSCFDDSSKQLQTKTQLKRGGHEISLSLRFVHSCILSLVPSFIYLFIYIKPYSIIPTFLPQVFFVSDFFKKPPAPKKDDEIVHTTLQETPTNGNHYDATNWSCTKHRSHVLRLAVPTARSISAHRLWGRTTGVETCECNPCFPLLLCPDSASRDAFGLLMLLSCVWC